MAIHNFRQNKFIDDFRGNAPPVQLSYLSIASQLNKLEFKMFYEQQSWSIYKWSMERCECSNKHDLRRTYRIGAALLYYLEVGSNRLRPYGGLSIERLIFSHTGTVGTGNNILPFPMVENDRRVMADLSDNGYAASMIIGGYYHISPKFSVSMQMRYSNWLGSEPLVAVDVRYFSSDFSYDLEVKDNGRILYLTSGIRLNIAGRNY